MKKFCTYLSANSDSICFRKSILKTNLYKRLCIIALLAFFSLSNNVIAQNPNFLWAKQLGGANQELGNSIAVDANGNVYTAGSFQSTVDFDPGPAIYNLTAVSSFGGNDIFISKLDASGNFLWAKQLGGVLDDAGFSIAVDGNGNIYTTGYFTGTADFDPGPGTYNLNSAGTEDIFVSVDYGNEFWNQVVKEVEYLMWVLMEKY